MTVLTSPIVHKMGLAALSLLCSMAPVPSRAGGGSVAATIGRRVMQPERASFDAPGLADQLFPYLCVLGAIGLMVVVTRFLWLFFLQPDPVSLDALTLVGQDEVETPVVGQPRS